MEVEAVADALEYLEARLVSGAVFPVQSDFGLGKNLRDQPVRCRGGEVSGGRPGVFGVYGYAVLIGGAHAVVICDQRTAAGDPASRAIGGEAGQGTEIRRGADALLDIETFFYIGVVFPSEQDFGFGCGLRPQSSRTTGRGTAGRYGERPGRVRRSGFVESLDEVGVIGERRASGDGQCAGVGTGFCDGSGLRCVIHHFRHAKTVLVARPVAPDEQNLGFRQRPSPQ